MKKIEFDIPDEIYNTLNKRVYKISKENKDTTSFKE